MNKPDKQEEYERLLAEVGLTLDDCRVHEVHPSDWLEGPEDYAMYLNDALATGDVRYIALCLKDIAEVAGVNLPDNLMPSIESLFNMLRGANVQLHAGAKAAEAA